MRAVHVLHQLQEMFLRCITLIEWVYKRRLQSLLHACCAEARQSCVGDWSNLPYQVKKDFFFLHSETVVSIRCLPSCQVTYLQLYVCAQYFLTADGKLSTRRTVVADWWGCDSTIFGLGLFVAILPGKLRNSPVPSPYAWGLVQISSWLSAGWYKFNEQCMSPLGPSRAYT